VHIVPRQPLDEAAETHKDAADEIQSWQAIVKGAHWRKFEDVRRIAGFNTLTLDMRGFGESGGKHGDFNRMPEDVDTALEFLRSQPGVDHQEIGLGGAGWLGVTYSVEAARRHPNDIKSLVLMSGETGRDGLQFLHQERQLPELFVFSDEDEYPRDETRFAAVLSERWSKRSSANISWDLNRDIRAGKRTRPIPGIASSEHCARAGADT
jgi:pimeloyl-ACP methyl ester carboxylesterase